MNKIHVPMSTTPLQILSKIRKSSLGCTPERRPRPPRLGTPGRTLSEPWVQLTPGLSILQSSANKGHLVDPSAEINR